MTITETLAQLVAISSVSGKEKELADTIERWLGQHAPNAAVERFEDNIIVHIQGVDRSAALVFNGHIDTVQAGDEALWYTPPFTLTQQGTRLYGLGASDMKGADAVYLHLAQEFSHTTPPCDIFFMFVTQEETTGAGTQKSLDHLRKQLEQYDRVAGIVGEATHMQVALGHRGNIFAKVEFTGAGGHGSAPLPLEKQATQKALRFAESLKKLQQEWRHTFPDKLLGPPSITVTGLQAGEGSINQIPTKCTVMIDVRTNTAAHAQASIKLSAWARQYDGEIDIMAEAPVGSCDPAEAIARTAMKLAHQSTPEVRRGSTDQCFFTAAGIPAIICGPGNPETIHAPNEYIEGRVLGQALERYQAITAAWAAQ